MFIVETIMYINSLTGQEEEVLCLLVLILSTSTPLSTATLFQVCEIETK